MFVGSAVSLFCDLIIPEQADHMSHKCVLRAHGLLSPSLQDDISFKTEIDHFEISENVLNSPSRNCQLFAVLYKSI